MPHLRLALAQSNPTVGDLAGNARELRAMAHQAWSAGADLFVTPEMALTGYPVEDLSLRPSFQKASRQAVESLARDLDADGCGDLVCLIGYLDHSDEIAVELGRPRGGPVNAAALVHGGRIHARYDKNFLPNYGVFDEARYFVPGDRSLLFDLGSVRVCVAICEDLWRDNGPASWAQTSGAGLMAVLNASPYERLKDDQRLALCQRRARDSGAVVAYANMVGGQDELVFDGDSLVVSGKGVLIARAQQFSAEVLLTDVEVPESAEVTNASVIRFPSTHSPERKALPSQPPAQRLDDLAEVYHALRLGLSDYVNKNAFPSIILGLSGGIDSALVAALSVDALGKDRVFGVAMPSEYSSQHSIEDAHDLAMRTGLSIRDVPISQIFSAFQISLAVDGLAAENLQARIRGMILMSLSNSEGHLVLATGNKSELSVGYSTIYGDAVGGFAPIKDVPKTLVWDLARWRNDHAEAHGQIPPIPEHSISKAPSAELRPNQLDSDSLPNYPLLDAILEAYIDTDAGASEILASGFDGQVVDRILSMTDRAEYKRRQFPPGTKIGARAFGRDRRLPITNLWREKDF